MKCPAQLELPGRGRYEIVSSMVLGCRSVDYARFSISQYTGKDELLVQIFEWLGCHFADMGYGRHRYKQGLRAVGQSISIYHDGIKDPDGNDTMGVCVEISGEGCRWIESRVGFECWSKWCREARERFGAKFTRFDVTHDDLSGRITFDRVLKACVNWELVTKTRPGNYQLIDSPGKDFVGRARTLYVGSRSSESFLRIYDRGAKLGGESWLRFEAELTGDRAESAVTAFIAGGWDLLTGAVRGMWEFVTPSGDSNRSRWSAASWWAEFMGSCRFRLALPEKAAQTVQRLACWARRCWAAPAAALTEAYGGSTDWMYELLEIGADRARERYGPLIAHYGAT